MTRLVWGTVGERFYETGIDRGVLYLDALPGVPWNGLISVSESPSGGESEKYYLDGFNYANSTKPEEFEATIEAYSYPDEFAICDGTNYMANGLFITQQQRKSFGLVYRTRVGNDVDGVDHGYKLHIIYNAKAAPSERSYSSISDDPEASSFSWKITTRQVKFEDPAFGVKYGSHLVLDSRVVYPWVMMAVENVLYGDETSNARLPPPQELLSLFVDNALLKITDNGDGTWTAEGPDAIFGFSGESDVVLEDPTEPGTFLIQDPDVILESEEPGTYTWTGGLRETTGHPGTYVGEEPVFSITWPSAIMLDEDTYVISSL